MFSSLASPLTATRRTVLQKVRGRASSCCATAGRKHRVSGSLSLPSRGTFHLSLTVLYAIGHWVVFSLGGWSPRLPTRFPVSRGTPDPARPIPLPVRGSHPLRQAFPKPFQFSPLPDCGPLPRCACTTVWALPRSLAATDGIDVSFSSSGYLDVSVPRVPLHALWIGAWIHEVFSCGFPHSDICGSADMCSSPQLFAAYHVLRRLPVPRHPPCALVHLTSFGSSYCLEAPMLAYMGPHCTLRARCASDAYCLYQT